MTTLATTAAPPAVQDCWKKIGVWGDGTCAELKAAKHCRHCAVYSSVGLGLLDRELPAEYLASATAQLERPKPQRATGNQSALLFRIGTEWLALTVSAFVEVVERRVLHSVPHLTGSLLRGLVNVRGEILLCVSLNQLLGLPEQGEPAAGRRAVYERLLVVARGGQRLVFPVSEIFGLHRFHPEELKAAPATVVHNSAPYIKAVLPWQKSATAAPAAERVSVGLLDDELLFHTLNRSLA